MKEKLILAVSGSSVIYDLTTKKDKSVTKQHEALLRSTLEMRPCRPNGYKTRLQNFAFNGNRHTVARVSCPGYFATFKTDFSVMSVFFIDYRLYSLKVSRISNYLNLTKYGYFDTITITKPC